MAIRVQIRGGTAAEWTAANPILAHREFAIETDTNKLKVGNGSSNWAALPYVFTLSPDDASEIMKGAVEEGTDVEVQAGTAVGGTGARLFVNPAKLATWWTWIKTQTTALTGRFTAKHIAASWSTLTDAATIAWNADVNGNFTTVTIAGNRTLGAITNPLARRIIRY